MHFVIDTNITLSASLLAGSVPRQASDKALDTGVVLIAIPVLLGLVEVLSRKKLNKYLLEADKYLQSAYFRG